MSESFKYMAILKSTHDLQTDCNCINNVVNSFLSDLLEYINYNIYRT